MRPFRDVMVQEQESHITRVKRLAAGNLIAARGKYAYVPKTTSGIAAGGPGCEQPALRMQSRLFACEVRMPQLSSVLLNTLFIKRVRPPSLLRA